MEGVDAVEGARVNQTHEQIADVSPVFGPIKQRIFSMKNRLFQNLFTNIIIEWRSRNPEKQGQRFPMFQHIGDGLSHGGVGLDLPLIELVL